MRNGDIILTGRKHQGIASEAIRLGSKFRYGFDSPYAVWPHTAIVYDANKMLVCESSKDGVVISSLPERFGDDWLLVPTEVSEGDWLQVKAFLDSCVAAKWRYGKVTFISLGLYCLAAQIPFLPTINFETPGTAVCSGLVCQALTRAGYIWELPPDYMMPADIAKHFDVRG